MTSAREERRFRAFTCGRRARLRNVQSDFVHRIVALSVGAALMGVPHRIAYRSALYEHDLVVHPVRSVQVATDRRVRTTRSARPQADERLRSAISRQ